MIQFEFPTPPSANALFANAASGKGRIKTTKYDAWIDEAGWMVQLQRRTSLARRTISEEVDVEILVDFKEKGKSDLDNRIKPILDLMKKMHVIVDDKLVISLNVRFSPEAPEGKCVVRIE